MATSTPYQPLPNSFRDSVRNGERLIGGWSSLASPITTELLGLIGFDWLLLDAEHAPNDVLTLIPQLMALKDSPSAPFVRPPADDSVVIKRMLDAGFFNFLIPFVDSADDAKRAIAATRYPPLGVRHGVASERRTGRKEPLHAEVSTRGQRVITRARSLKYPLALHRHGEDKAPSHVLIID
jgi:2-dehydro-3-deoxyglucarate aldolase